MTWSKLSAAGRSQRTETNVFILQSWWDFCSVHISLHIALLFNNDACKLTWRSKWSYYVGNKFQGSFSTHGEWIIFYHNPFLVLPHTCDERPLLFRPVHTINTFIYWRTFEMLPRWCVIFFIRNLGMLSLLFHMYMHHFFCQQYCTKCCPLYHILIKQCFLNRESIMVVLWENLLHTSTTHNYAGDRASNPLIRHLSNLYTFSSQWVLSLSL